MKLDLEEITPKFYRILKQFAPFGPGNMRPVFYSKNVKSYGFSKRIGRDKNHLKCSIKSANSNINFPAIGFNLGKKINLIQQNNFEIAYSIEENTWKEKTIVQLNLRYLR